MAKAMYIGSTISSILCTNDTILSQYFNSYTGPEDTDDHGFYYRGANTWASANQDYDDYSDYNNSVAQQVLVVSNPNVTHISLTYGVSSETNYDFFTFKYNDTIIARISGEQTGTWSSDVQPGDMLTFTYSKDISRYVGNDQGWFSNVKVDVQHASSVAAKISTAYVGINGAARKIVRGYIGDANGKAREIYSANTVRWKKYNAIQVENPTYQEITPTRGTEQHSFRWLTAYYAYEFNRTSGYYGGYYNGIYNNNEDIQTVEDANALKDTLVGMYHIYDTEVWEIVSVDKIEPGYTSNLLLTLTFRLVAECERTYDEVIISYDKGDTLLDEFTAAPGALPQTGTLIEGSATSSYCVLQINGSYYYYEKEVE